MDEPLSSEIDRLQDTQVLHRLLVYETACALAESASLADAAPRMLRAVCVALGWEYGALWEVDRARTSLRWVSSWQQRSADFEAFADVSRQMTFAAASACPAGSGPRASPRGFPTSCRTTTSRARPSPARVGLHSAFALPMLRDGDVLGVMEFFSRDIRQPDDGPARDADDRRQPDRPVRRAEARDRGARPLLHALARPALHRDLRRLLPPRQSGLAARARVRRGGAARGIAVHRLRPPRRSRGHARRRCRRCRTGAHVIDFENRYRARRRLVQVAASGPRRRCPSRASSTPPRATSPIASWRRRRSRTTPHSWNGHARAGTERRAARAARRGARHRAPPSRRGDASRRASSSPT